MLDKKQDFVSRVSYVLLLIGGLTASCLPVYGQDGRGNSTHQVSQNTQDEEDGYGEEDGIEDEDEFGEEGFDDGGGEFEDIEVKPIKAPPPPRDLLIDGFIRSHWAMWTQRDWGQMWAKGRQSLDLNARYKKGNLLLVAQGHFEYDLLYPLSDQSFDEQHRKDYESQLLRGQQYFGYRWDEWDLKVGRQIVNWGEGDGLSTLDLINPQDQREPGISDLDDLRLAVFSTRIQRSFGSFTFDALIRHEGYYGLWVPPFGEYSSFRRAVGDNSLPPPFSNLTLSGRFRHKNTGVSADSQSYFLRMLYRGKGLDLGFYAASLIDLQGTIGIDLDPSALAGLGSGQFNIILPVDHQRYTVVGQSGSLPLSSFLVKWELAGYLNRQTTTGIVNTLPPVLEVNEVSTLNTFLSLTYNGIQNFTFALEYQDARILDGKDQTFLIPPDLGIFAGRISAQLLKETLNLNAVFSLIDFQAQSSLFGDDVSGFQLDISRGAFARIDAQYALNDHFKLQIGYAHYWAGDEFGPFYGLTRHNRLFTQLRWDFTLY